MASVTDGASVEADGDVLTGGERWHHHHGIIIVESSDVLRGGGVGSVETVAMRITDQNFFWGSGRFRRPEQLAIRTKPG